MPNEIGPILGNIFDVHGTVLQRGLSWSEIVSNIDDDKPVIAWVWNSPTSAHVVVIVGYRDPRIVQIFDPLTGPTEVPYDSFAANWGPQHNWNITWVFASNRNTTTTGSGSGSRQIECQHRVACTHRTECSHRQECLHRIPCSHQMACVHRIACQHPIWTPYGWRPAHPFDTIHPFDVAHPFDTVHPFDTAHPFDTMHAFDTLHAFDMIN